MAVLDSLLDRASAKPPTGGALLVRGEPGIGKSALLEAAAGRARDRGMHVLTCVGVAGESHLPFAGLHQLLWPVRRYAERLPSRERDALRNALGLTDAPYPGIFLIGLATLDLLGECARQAPVLVVADDVQYLDYPTCEVLAFLGTRLEADPVVQVAACRDEEGDPGPMGTGCLPELKLGPLNDTSAAALLDAHGQLDPLVRRRVLEEAVGNPLALVELPQALQSISGEADLPTWLPLTARLESAYAARLTALPEASRTALLALALDDGEQLAEALEAASRAAGAPISAADLEPAVAAGLVELGPERARFRHPLIRSAVSQAAGAGRRQQMHGALADVLAAAPERRVWHRAAATVGPDDEVAAELEQAAARAHRDGTASVAVAALSRAAELARPPARKGSLLLRAAEQAHELGRSQTTMRLLDEAASLDLHPGDRIQLLWFREIIAPSSRSGKPPLDAFAELADRMWREGGTDVTLDALVRLAMRAWWYNPDPAAYRRLADVAEATAAAEDDPRLLNILALSDPSGRGAVVLDRLRRCPPGAGDPVRDYVLGLAAQAVGDSERAFMFHEAAGAGLRAHGQLGALGENLLAQAWTAVHLGRLEVAAATADEGGRLLTETRGPFWATGTQLVTAIVAGRRGQAPIAADLAGQAERVIASAGVRHMLAQVQLARGVAALGQGRYDEAYEQLARIFDPLDFVYHARFRTWALADYAVAACLSGHQDAARAVCDELSREAATGGSPLLRAGLAVAAPMVAEDDEAEALFGKALSADLTVWPLHRARLLLAYGSWLRRRQYVVESRTPLRTARDLFDSLGELVGGERARQELDAAGENSGQRVQGALDRLSPQEWQIARLAADGLTNREIGQQLYLSHRTIGNHLYRVFPKLGITSRAELGAALTGRALVSD